MKSLSNIILALILFLAIVLRFANLTNVPNGFNDDEAAFGYNAYSILKTGKDEWGKTLPLTTFQSFGDHKLPVYFYLTTVPVYVFGLNEFAVRFPTALFGVISVFLTYVLTRKLFNTKSALVASFLLAVSPYHVFVSRHALESAIPIAFNLLGTILFLTSFKNKKLIYFSMLLFALSLYIYRSTWLFVPVYLGILFFTFRGELKKNGKNFIISACLFILLAIPILLTALSAAGSSRYKQIGITSSFNIIGLMNEVHEQRGICENQLNGIFCRMVHNKYEAVFTKYVANYVSHFSPQLLFTYGSNDGEQMMKGRGFLYFFQLPLILLGLIYLAKNYKSIQTKIVLPWILAYPLASATAGYETPGRQAIAMPIWEIITVVGLFTIYNYLKNQNKAILKIVMVFLLFISTYQIGKFVIDYYFLYPQTSPRSFRYGYRDLFTYLKAYEQEYDAIIVSNRIDQSHQYILQLFYTKVDPNLYLEKSYSHRYFEDGGWVVVTRVGKYNFVNSPPNLESFPKKTLLAVTVGEVKTHKMPVYSIKYPDGKTVFDVYDVEKLLAQDE